MNIHIGNAPCSWGTLEFADLSGERIDYRQMLDELAETGYNGTELGDWGFLPTAPAVLRAELRQRNLTMLGAFVPVALKDPAAHAAGAAHARKVARLLADVAGDFPPFVVLADDNGTDPIRTRHAGRATSAICLSEAEWHVFAQGAERIAQTVRAETGLRTVFHHHCAGYVETPVELRQLLDLTDPDLLGVVFDTGHFAYGAGTGSPDVLSDMLDTIGNRLWYMHFKDCHPDVAQYARTAGWDYFTAVQHGIFCELGQGCINFPAVVAWLRDHKYQGWITVEQDVLPGMGAPKESAQRNREYLRAIGL